MKKIILLCPGILFALNTALDPSTLPPNGLDVQKVPQFISFGFDDNGRSGNDPLNLPDQNYRHALRWLQTFSQALKNPIGNGNIGTYDGSPVRFSFFSNGLYMDQQALENANNLRRVHHELWVAGHEIGNHTFSHGHGSDFTQSQWEEEIIKNHDLLARPLPPAERPNWEVLTTEGPGIPKSEVVGFRTPFLECNEPTFAALQKLNYTYDCSIEDGFESQVDGTNFNWPYTLDHASQSTAWQKLITMSLGNIWVPDKRPLNDHPGLWEYPAQPYMIPQGEVALQYGLTAGQLDKHGSKITGFDYNMLANKSGGLGLTKEESLAILKYTLDLRLQGNRAPMMLGVHSDYYHPIWDGNSNISTRGREEVIEEFIQYALTKSEVRIVPGVKVIDWMKNPVAFDQQVVSPVLDPFNSMSSWVQGDYLKIPKSKVVQVQIVNIQGQILVAQNFSATLEQKEWKLPTFMHPTLVLIRSNGQVYSQWKMPRFD